MNQSKNQEIEGKITHYLSGEISEQESEFMLNWLRENDDNKRLFAEHKKIWLASRAIEAFDSERIETGREKTKLKIQAAELDGTLSKSRLYTRLWGYAASILLIICLITSYFAYSLKAKSVSFSDLSETVIEVPYGSKSQIVLPDGSKVWINAGSKIRYSSNFGASSRDIYLEGEAYFDVKENKEIPFFVKTDLYDIRVYGTAFNVKSYLDDNVSETTLDKGSITIIPKEKPDEIVQIEPNQKIVIQRRPAKNEKTGSSQPPLNKIQVNKPDEDILFGVEDNVDTKNITAWKDNRLVFEQEPLEILGKRLERRYNVNISFSDEKMKSIRFSAVLKEMPIDQVLKAIALISPIQYTIDGMDVTLSENKNFKYIKFTPPIIPPYNTINKDTIVLSTKQKCL